MREFEELLDAEGANYSVVISENEGLKRVIRKIYFYIPLEVEIAKALIYTAENYPWDIVPGMRIDIYRVRDSKVIGR